MPDRPSLPLPKPSPRVLWRAFGFLRPHWKLTAGAYLMMLLIDIFAMLNPQLIRWAIDHGVEQGNARLLALAVAALLLIVVVKGVFTYFEGVWTEIASQNVAYDLRNKLQRKITLLSFSFHDQAEAGDLLSRTIQDVERIRFLTGRAMFRIIEGVFLLLLTAGMLIWMNPKLGLLAIAAMPLLVVQSIRFGRRYRPLSMLIQKQLGTLTTRLEQNLRGARVVKTFAQEEAEIERFEHDNNQWFNLSAEARPPAVVQHPLPATGHQPVERVHFVLRRHAGRAGRLDAGRAGGFHHLHGAAHRAGALFGHDPAGYRHGRRIGRAHLRDPRPPA